MSSQKRMKVLSLAVFLALLAAAVMPLSAMAQDEAPPQPEAPVVVDEDPVVDEQVVDEPAAEEPAVEEPAVEEPVVDEPVADEPVVEEPAADEPAGDQPLTVPDILQAAPEGTEVMVVNEAGAPEPLATQDAAEVIVASDPMWCPKAATAVTSDCVNADTVTNLLPLINSKTEAGVIYFTSSYTANDVTLGISAGDIYYYSLTLQGGWKQSTNLGDPIVFSGGSVFSVPVTINWFGNVTINDISIIGASGDNGLHVATTGDVVLNNVAANANNVENAGIHIQIQAPGFEGGPKAVDPGPTVVGNVFLNNVTANTNSLYGIDISIQTPEVGFKAVEPAPVTGGNVTLNKVTANGNGAHGVSVDTPGALNVSSSQFNGNIRTTEWYGADGLSAFATGGITLRNVTANSNEGSGVFLYTNFSENGPTIYCSQFENNDWANIDAAYENKLTINGVTFAGAPEYGDIYISSEAVVARNDAYDCNPFIPCDPDDDQEETPGGQEIQEGGEREPKPQNGLTPQIPVTGPVICNGEKTVPLEPGDGVGVFQNLCGFDFQLQEVTNNSLPGALPDGFTYFTSMDAGLFADGQAVDELPADGKLTLRFPIPNGADETNLAVLFWNGAAWVEIPGGEVVDGFYVVEVTKPGVYVLATQ